MDTHDDFIMRYMLKVYLLPKYKCLFTGWQKQIPETSAPLVAIGND
jgi:hypothetical protein